MEGNMLTNRLSMSYTSATAIPINPTIPIVVNTSTNKQVLVKLLIDAIVLTHHLSKDVCECWLLAGPALG